MIDHRMNNSTNSYIQTIDDIKDDDQFLKS